jgi:hypothetical protein
MKVIWKFKIPGPEAEFDAPTGAKAVRATIQQLADGQQPILYLLCDRQAAPAKHRVRLHATGASVPDDSGEYVDTLTVKGQTGPLVVHIFHLQLGLITQQ